MRATFKVTIKTSSHAVHVKVSGDGHIHCFKYDNRTCDFAVFEDQWEASEYILESLPTTYYQVTVQNE